MGAFHVKLLYGLELIIFSAIFGNIFLFLGLVICECITSKIPELIGAPQLFGNICQNGSHGNTYNIVDLKILKKTLG